MSDTAASNLSRIFNSSNNAAMVEECTRTVESLLTSEQGSILRNHWKLTTDLYKGQYPGYRACNTEYHDYSHIGDVLCATIRMCDGAVSSGMKLDQDFILDTCTAAMLHDTGYIQKYTDTDGTGAKYTKTHVTRSIVFTEENQEYFGLSEHSAKRIGRLIAGTDLALEFNNIPFEDPTERLAAELLSSADLLGQMADRAYLEKLLFLYYEFREASFPGYNTEFDILKKTLSFYESTKQRLFTTLNNATRFAQEYFKNRYNVDRNLYLEAIENQIEYLQTIIEDDTINFRKKLKRLDLEEVSRTHQHIEMGM